MLDIAIIREKPDWVKDQIRKVQDEPALLRIDRILELDASRRQRIREREELQKVRNSLNKAYGFLRGNKKLEANIVVGRLQQAASQLQTRDYAAAEAVQRLFAGAPRPQALLTFCCRAQSHTLY